MELLRNPCYEQEGWRVVHADATLPPNLRCLQVVDCDSATPLLALTQLTGLTIAQHCSMPAAELKRLSSMTQLDNVHLGYQMCRGGGGEEFAQEGSPGWNFVPALQTLELHRAVIDPAGDLLQHLAACTSLTRLVWESPRFMPGSMAFGPAGVEPEHVMTYRDGGLTALGAALPANLKVVEFEDFMPQPDGGPGGHDEAAMVLGLYHLQCDIDALPHLQSFIMWDQNYPAMYSEAGVQLIRKILQGEENCNEPEQAAAFISAHADAYPHYFCSDADDDNSDDCDDEGGNESEEGGGAEGSSDSEEGAGAEDSSDSEEGAGAEGSSDSGEGAGAEGSSDSEEGAGAD